MHEFVEIVSEYTAEVENKRTVGIGGNIINLSFLFSKLQSTYV